MLNRDMAQPSPPPPSRPAAPPRGGRDARSGYAKGEETRRAILAAALAEFGEHGLANATTRRIARAAGVTLPSLAYYFGNKEGVYLACASEIVDRYVRQMASISAADLTEALTRADSAACRAHLKQLLRHLVQLLAGSDDALTWTTFVERELREQGPAFTILYERLWEPGVRLLARLIAGVRGATSARDADTIDALLLISSLVAFYTGRAVSLRTLGWKKIGKSELEALFAAADRLADGVSGGAEA
ncbi:CerR family C-terminal domain-containing protein [Camelimonas sp. ID_303_24]